MHGVGRRHGILIDAVLADVPDHADDLEPLGLAVVTGAEREPLADRIGVGELAARHRLVDHQDAGIEGSVSRLELAAADEGHAERGEVTRRHGHEVRQGRFVRRQLGTAGDVEREETEPAAHRQRVGERHALDAGHGLQPLLHRVPVGQPLRRLAVALARRRHLHRQHARRGEAQRDVQQVDEAAEQQPGADQQHQRQRDLGQHQAHAGDVAVAVAGGAARGVLEGALQFGPRRLPRRDDAEQQAGQHRQRAGEAERVAVDRDGRHARNLTRLEREDQVDPQKASSTPSSPPTTARGRSR